MKNVKFLLSAACALFAVAAMAQQDFSDPKYAVWGDTPQEREQNILNSNFLKESLDNPDVPVRYGLHLPNGVLHR